MRFIMGLLHGVAAYILLALDVLEPALGFYIVANIWFATWIYEDERDSSQAGGERS